ncbi:hypothetical protein KJ813_02330 [bacterium]|nr:hypothetical protein [bacterium]MBU4361483.1 hypothetical protein [bacterium]MBU4601745.1 hypothetical protein [bacterium]
MVNIYGTGQLAEITYYAGISTPLKLDAIISDDPSKEKFLGQQTISIYQQPGEINQRNK